MLRSVRLSPGGCARQAPQTQGARQPVHVCEPCVSSSGHAPRQSRDDAPRISPGHGLPDICTTRHAVAAAVGGGAAATNLLHASAAAASEAVTVEAPVVLAVVEAPVLDVEVAVDQLAPVPASLADAAASSAEAAAQDAAALLGNASASALGAAEAVQDATSAAAAAAAAAASSVTEDTVEALAAASSAVTAVASDATSAVTAAASGATSAVLAAASDVTAAASGATSAVTSAASEATAAVTGTLAKAVDGATGALDAVGSTVGDATAAVTATAGSAVAAVTSAVDDSVAAITDATASVQGAVLSSVAATTEATSAAVAGAVSQLPPEAQSALFAVPRALAWAANLVATYPLPVAVGTAAVAVPLTARYLQERYGGYAGELQPYEAYDALLNEDALLVDVRSEADRAAGGLPELKYQSRFKATVWQPVALDPALARRAGNSRALEVEVNAAYLAGLRQVKGPLTKLIILDTAGSDAARDLARALRSVGGIASPYIVSGGFRAWVESGLGVKEGGALVYEGNVVEYLQDEIELLGQQVVEATQPLKDPIVATSLGAGLIAAAVAVYNYKTTLEWIGVLGLMASAANCALKYDSPQDMAADVQRSWGKLAGGLSKPRPPTSAGSGAPKPVVRPVVPAGKPEAAPAAYSNGTAAAAKEGEEGGSGSSMVAASAARSEGAKENGDATAAVKSMDA